MFWFRIDNRLIHGQIIEGWLPYLDANELVVVNNELAENDIQQHILLLAVPGRIHVRFIAVSKAKDVYDTLAKKNATALFLVANCTDAALLVENGLPIPVLNVGNMHFSKGMRQLCGHVAASESDLHCLRSFRQNGTQLDFRCVPTDVPQLVEGWWNNDER